MFIYWSEPETSIFQPHLCERFRGHSPSLLRYLCLSLCLHLWCSAISWHFLFRPDGIKTLIYNKNYSVSPSYTTDTFLNSKKRKKTFVCQNQLFYRTTCFIKPNFMWTTFRNHTTNTEIITICAIKFVFRFG